MERSQPVPPPLIRDEELEQRIERLRDLMHTHKLDAVAVYGDEKHYENAKYLTGFDPRFESVLVIVTKNEPDPWVVMGAESKTLFEVTGRIGKPLVFLPFSIQGLPGDYETDLVSMLRTIGIERDAEIGLIGQRYFTKREYPDDPTSHHFVPHFVWEALVEVVGSSRKVRNATTLLVNRGTGLRDLKSAHEIVALEWASYMAARGIARMLNCIKPGMTELEVMAEGFHAGGAATFAFQPTVLSGLERTLTTLASPSGRTIELGDPVTMHYGPTFDGYCGNIDRMGFMAESASDLPHQARDAVRVLYQPMFDAYLAMIETIGVGVPGSQVYNSVFDHLKRAGLETLFNAGHLIGMSEWEETVTTASDSSPISSGHVMQADFHVLTHVHTHGPARIQDGFALADESLQDQIRSKFPETWSRFQRRRDSIAAVGVQLDDSVLPLSDLSPRLAPFLLDRSFLLTPSN